MDVLKALSDETRLRIINLLYERELCVCDLMEVLKSAQSKTSRHLAYLKNAGLVSDRKHAQWVYYSLPRDKHLRFLDSLVLDNLRELALYREDLDTLEKWLMTKKNACNENISMEAAEHEE